MGVRGCFWRTWEIEAIREMVCAKTVLQPRCPHGPRSTIADRTWPT